LKSLTIIILTKNETLHLIRAIESIKSIATRIVVIDSNSTDNTVTIAKELGAEVFQNNWINYANQFQWGLDNTSINTDWVMRLDADEYIYPELANEINEKLYKLDKNISGIYLKLRVIFMDTWIKRGYYPMTLLRIWRKDAGNIEQKWMDEHIKLSYGTTSIFDNDMADHNLNNLTWWTTKQNGYAIREAIDRLNRKYNFLDSKYDTEYISGTKKKWYKSMYMNLPKFIRPFLYFVYRYIFRLGFLEGKPGLIWHFLQGFWLQFLVDAKIEQIERISKSENKSIKEVIEQNFGIKLE
jgi:glycosyltransferase involved in cell wall biosynthesis